MTHGREHPRSKGKGNVLLRSAGFRRTNRKSVLKAETGPGVLRDQVGS